MKKTLNISNCCIPTLCFLQRVFRHDELPVVFHLCRLQSTDTTYDIYFSFSTFSKLTVVVVEVTFFTWAMLNLFTTMVTLQSFPNSGQTTCYSYRPRRTTSAPVFCKPIAHLFKLSLASSTVPVQWKQAATRPIPKVNTPKQPADFHPISVTPVLTRSYTTNNCWITYRQTISTFCTVFSHQNLLLHRIIVSVLVFTIYSYRLILIISLTLTLSFECYSETCINV